MTTTFELHAAWQPQGDQPQAIATLSDGFARGARAQTLLGVTGSGKTFTAAHVIRNLGLPTLVIAPNKTLAAQLYAEFRELLPRNAVEYFVSYYDYYQPEAYVPSSDTYIDKEATINDAIDRMRHSATRALLERKDVVIVASVSCIYGLGDVSAYGEMVMPLQVGDTVDRDAVLRRLTDIQYARNDVDFHRGTFRVRGDVLEVFPAHEAERALRIEWFGDVVDQITLIDPLRSRTIEALQRAVIYPSSHYVVQDETRRRALTSIRNELQERLTELRGQNRLLESQRLEQRTLFDLEMLEQMGHCHGIENYSRHLTGRAPAEPPPTLLDYLPRDHLIILDESHQTVPQIGAMLRGDRSRKETLVSYGFRLPSALDNRPLSFAEFESRAQRLLFVSATPGDYELECCAGVVVEQVIRPTGLVDPDLEVRPAERQVDDLLDEIRQRVGVRERVLVTTLTKRMAEDLTEYYAETGVRVRYMHSDIDTLERVEILRDLRQGAFDVLVGINLLREGLDLPEVSLVAVFDADREGYLRSGRSLIQTIGRAARNIHGKVILYADRMTDSMRHAISETERRRALQQAHNLEHGITPRSVERAIRAMLPIEEPARPAPMEEIADDQLPRRIEELRRKMMRAAERLSFEEAAVFRDQLKILEDRHLGLGPPSTPQD